MITNYQLPDYQITRLPITNYQILHPETYFTEVEINFINLAGICEEAVR
jgi:hypothetical protein